MHMPPPVHGAAMVGKYIHDSEVVNSTFDCHYINLTTAASLEDIGCGGLRKALRFAVLLRTIVRTIRAIKPEVVYVTPNACGGAFYKDFIVVQAIKRYASRIVVHYHNKGVSTRQNRWLDDRLYRRFFRGLKVIILAEALYQDVAKYVRREDLFICPNGIPETLTAEPTAKRSNTTPRLLFLSNLLESKGVLVLLDACKILKDKGCAFVCDLVGGETAEIDAMRIDKEIRDRGLSATTSYRGRKYGADKEAAFAQADIFVFPTYYPNETFGLVNLEAMEHKLPIVSTDEGGIRDVVKDGENGFIAEKKNAESLAKCIETLLNDEKLRLQFGEDGYKKFKGAFTLPTFEARIVKVLTNVIGGVN